MIQQSLTYEKAIQCHGVIIHWPQEIWAGIKQPMSIVRTGGKWGIYDAMRIKFAADCGYRITEAK